MGQVNTRWFKDQLGDKKISQRKLAGLLGLDPAAVTLMFRGDRSMKMEEAVEIARIIGLPLDDVLAQAGMPVPKIARNTVGVTGWIDGDNRVHEGPVQGPRRAETPAGAPADCVALRYQTVGTPLDHFNGALAYYKPRDYVAPEALGRLAVVEDMNGEKFIRIVRHGYEAGSYITIDPQTGKQESISLKSASPVLWTKH